MNHHLLLRYPLLETVACSVKCRETTDLLLLYSSKANQFCTTEIVQFQVDFINLGQMDKVATGASLRPLLTDSFSRKSSN